MPLTPSRALLLRKLRDCFPDPGAANDALHSLEHYQEDSPADTDAVHLAIIKLSEGKLWRLRDYIQLAKKDPRDVIILAQQPEMTRYRQKRHASLSRGLRLKPISLSKKVEMEMKEAAIRRRDREQWENWLKSPGA